MMYGSEIFGGAGTGAATGATIGSLFPGIGTGLGAGAGALIGGAAGFFRGRGNQKKKQAVGQARMQLEQLGRDQRAQRMADLDKAMAFFQPAEAELRRLYGG